jgi:hypothetical protein
MTTDHHVPASPDPRARLLTALLDGRPRHEIVELARHADWTEPAELVVATAEVSADFHGRSGPQPGTNVLVMPSDDRLTVVGAEGATRRLVEVLAASPNITRIAVTWAVCLEEVPRARRWTLSALELVRDGLIGDRGVIECAQHGPALWLHADPVLARHTAVEVLAPLNDLRTHVRATLGETLLLWLKTHASAPALAERLDTHPNTVRRRLQVLRELFGERLSDPEQTLPLLGMLEINMPAWRLADTSGRPRYRQKT